MHTFGRFGRGFQMNGVGALFWKMYAEMDCHEEMETQRVFQS